MKRTGTTTSFTTPEEILAQTHLQLWFDGACEPINPGGCATYGWVLKNESEHILAYGQGCIGIGDGMTNNVAEYTALIKGLEHLTTLQWNGYLSIFGDSQLVIHQITGAWHCHKLHLRRLRDVCLQLLNRLVVDQRPKLQWIPREENDEADALTRRAYEEQTKTPFPERQRFKSSKTDKRS